MLDPRTQLPVTDPDTHQPVKDPAELESWAEWVRERVGKKPPEDSQVKTPDSIIRDLDELSYYAGQNVMILREADRTRRAARRMHAKALLIERGLAEGTVDDRKAAAEVGAMAEWEISDAAEVAYEYARSVADQTRSRAIAVQAQAKQVELMYQLAGRGRA